MTLVSALVTKTHVTVAADRRLTKGHEIVDDLATKMVIVCNQGVVCYSGMAELNPGGPRLDEWIVAVLRKCAVRSLDEAASVLLREVGPAVRRSRYEPSSRKLMLMLAGWTRKPDLSEIPVVATISNVMAALDGRRQDVPSHDFEIRTQLYDPNRTALAWMGASFPRDRWEMMRSAIAQGTTLTHVENMLARSIRSVASRTHTVGTRVHICSLPRPQLINGRIIMLLGSANERAVTYRDLGVPFVAHQVAPHFVCA